MEQHIYNEHTGISYTLQGGYYLPDLAPTEQEDKPIGLWGQRHLRYIKQHRKILYINLIMLTQNMLLMASILMIRILLCRKKNHRILHLLSSLKLVANILVFIAIIYSMNLVLIIMVNFLIFQLYQKSATSSVLILKN